MADGSKGAIRKPTDWQWWLAAVAVHVFTAAGIICGLLAVLAVFDGAYEKAFAWLGVALLIDGLDGTFARLVDIHNRLPRFSGERLDLVIDYVTYVFVPALAMHKAGFLPGFVGLLLTGLILMSSLYHFSDTANKSDDHCFVGFPAVWNIVAFYAFAFALPPLATALAVLACAVLTFVPMRWLHPMRVAHLLPLNLALTVLGGLACLWVLAQGFPAGPFAKIILVGLAVYAIGLALTRPLAATDEGGAT